MILENVLAVFRRLSITRLRNSQNRSGDRTRPFVNNAHMNSIYSVYLYISPRNTYTGKPHSLHLQEQKSDPVPARWK